MKKKLAVIMYNQLDGTPLQRYVADPAYGSMHNYGAAVDVTIADKNGKELDMGIHPFRKNIFQLGVVLVRYKVGEELNEEQKKNQKLLKDTMVAAGFHPIELEWWHFNGLKKAEIRNRYDIIE
ncbi:MAG: M15 family metallopeptidase [Halanaerobiales bacterium]